MKQYLKKIKELFNKLKEAWKVPRKKAGIKLVCYFIFLLIFFMIAAIGNRVGNEKSESNTTTTSTTSASETLSYKQKDLLNSNFNIKYEIRIDENNYTINGTLKSSVLEGYLEENTGIKKIKLNDGVLSEINNDFSNPLETNINTNLIDVKYILGLVEKNRAYIENKEEIKTYKYSLSIDDINNIITIFTDEKRIIKITINNTNSEYILNFDN